jgi:hypothetical protein
MKKNWIILYIFVILSVLCISVTGCSRKESTQNQEVSGMEYGISDTEEANPSESDHASASVSPAVTDSADTPVKSPEVTETGEDTEAGPSVVPVTDENGNPDVKTADVTKPPVSPEVEIIFQEASETVYASANVNIRTGCSIKEDNILATLHKGDSALRTGISEEWSRVIYQNKVCYIKSEYLSLTKQISIDTPEKSVITDTPEKPDITPLPAAPKEDDPQSSAKEDWAAKLAVSEDAKQLVIVIGNGGSDVTVSFHTKDDDGKWSQVFSTEGDCGSKGITYNKKEGDSKTPAGLYAFTMAFGIKADPGAKLPFLKITEYDYWIDDGKSPYYNTWVNSKEIPGDYSSEHLIDHSPQYN